MIRDYVEADRAQLEACVAELQETERPWFPELLPGPAMAPKYVDGLLEQVREKEGRLLVYEVDGALAGFICVQMRRNMDALESTLTAWAYISDLMVRADHRRMGIALKLLAAVERHVAERGVEWIRINHASRNAAAHETYIRAGYEDYVAVKRKRLR